MDYFNSKKITGTTMKTARLKVEEALKEEGFGVLTEIDIQATMKKNWLRIIYLILFWELAIQNSQTKYFA